MAPGVGSCAASVCGRWAHGDRVAQQAQLIGSNAADGGLARRLWAQAASSLDQVGHQLNGHPTAKQYRQLPCALGDLGVKKIPQYDRTYVQGCACSTRLAGGGCCPGGVSSLAAQVGYASHVAMAALGAVLGMLGVYFGIKITLNSANALVHLWRIEVQVRAQIAGLQLDAVAFTEVGRLTQSQRAAERKIAALMTYAQALKAATREQVFNLLVSGLLQTVASCAAIAAAAAHVGGGSIVAGVVASALFAAYGCVLTSKNAVAWWRCKPSWQPDPGAPLPPHYQQACATHLRARRQNLGRTAAAWACVGAAGFAGTLVSAGIWAAPLAGSMTLGVGLGASGWAMWQNSRSRYVLHLPLAEHTAPQSVGTTAQRASAFAYLAPQDHTITQVVRHLMQNQPFMHTLRYTYESLFLPQCGPTANQVVPSMVQHASAVQNASPEKYAFYRRQQIRAAQQFTQQECALIKARTATQHTALHQEHVALTPLFAADASKTPPTSWTPIQEAAYTRASAHLHDAAVTLELTAVGRLAVLDCLQRCLDHLQSQVDTHPDASLTPEQASTWTWARLTLLQLTGTLGEAVDAAFMAQYSGFFSQLSAPDAWPVTNVYVLPQHHQAFAQAIESRLDGAFLHAFLNPRRIAAEMDYLLDLELDACAEAKPNGSDDATFLVAPAAAAARCCG